MRGNPVLLCTNPLVGVYTDNESRRERGEVYALRLVPFFWLVRTGIGVRYPDISDLSGGCAPVPCGVSADWLRLCLPAQVGKENGMKIVIVKSPKFLKGILRMLFGIRE